MIKLTFKYEDGSEEHVKLPFGAYDMNGDKIPNNPVSYTADQEITNRLKVYIHTQVLRKGRTMNTAGMRD